jgi:hypothetical protein
VTRFRTDKEHPHGYLPDYLRVAEILGPAATVCEIGVLGGASLSMWQELFPASPAIIGIDRDPAAVWPTGTIRIVAQQDDPALGDQVRQHAPDGCDLIVDDASHVGHLSMATFAWLWPLVRPGGFYIVEDCADRRMFPDWPGWYDVDRRYYGDELSDVIPGLLKALDNGAARVTYTREGLVIIRRLP